LPSPSAGDLDVAQHAARGHLTPFTRDCCVGDEIENPTAVNGQIVGREGQGSAEVR
jgi:hypothetical protein